MAESSLSIATAPRQAEGLVNQSPFQLRLLAQKLGAFDSDETKMAWSGLSTPVQRAEFVADLLKAYDAANPGGAQPPPAAQPMNAAPPPVVAAVNPAAVAAAAAATAGTAAVEKPARQPRTNGTKATPAPNDADIGASVIDLLNKVSASNTETQNLLRTDLQKMAALLTEAADSKTSRVTALEGQVSMLMGAIESMRRMQRLTLSACLMFMQESMSASQADLLSSIGADAETLEALVAQATGKG